MTEEWANLLVFPFQSNDKLLANCVVIERVPLFTGNILSEDFLAFMLLFSSPGMSPLKQMVLCALSVFSVVLMGSTLQRREH